MVAKISGRVTNIKHLTTKKNKPFCVVKVMQIDKEGNAVTVPIRFWDVTRVKEIKQDAMIEIEGCVGAYISQSTGMALMSVDVWNGK